MHFIYCLDCFLLLFLSVMCSRCGFLLHYFVLFFLSFFPLSFLFLLFFFFLFLFSLCAALLLAATIMPFCFAASHCLNPCNPSRRCSHTLVDLPLTSFCRLCSALLFCCPCLLVCSFVSLLVCAFRASVHYPYEAQHLALERQFACSFNTFVD